MPALLHAALYVQAHLCLKGHQSTGHEKEVMLQKKSENKKFQIHNEVEYVFLCMRILIARLTATDEISTPDAFLPPFQSCCTAFP
jgi:hypothetical protein